MSVLDSFMGPLCKMKYNNDLICRVLQQSIFSHLILLHMYMPDTQLFIYNPQTTTPVLVILLLGNPTTSIPYVSQVKLLFYNNKIL